MDVAPVLQVSDLQTNFYTPSGIVPAVDGISFEVFPGETLGIVGESGCGKSVTALSILRLIQTPPGKIERGRVYLDDRNILTLSSRQMQAIRGNQISMIFQEPMTSLNPVFTIGNQMNEVFQLHQGLDYREATRRSVEMLQKVGVADPDRRVRDYPHALSGGMRQRVMIAMALSCRPKVLIADEPTTALDVTIQAQILDLIRSLQKEIGMAVIFISHDLGVVAEICDRVQVMYSGKIVESGSTTALFQSPWHPYTEGLLRSMPVLGGEVKARLTIIPGMVPEMSNLPPGCRFAERCRYAQDKCRGALPELITTGDRAVACFYPLDRNTKDT